MLKIELSAVLTLMTIFPIFTAEINRIKLKR